MPIFRMVTQMHSLHTLEGAAIQMWITFWVGGVIVYKLYISVMYKSRVLSLNTASRRCCHKSENHYKAVLFSLPLLKDLFLSDFPVSQCVPDQVFAFLPFLFLCFFVVDLL